MDKAGTNARGLDSALLEFERWLNHQASVRGWDIEGVEVKGRPPIFDWDLEEHELLGLKMGSLAKLPVEALDRPLDLMNTTLKRVDELRRLGEGLPGERAAGVAIEDKLVEYAQAHKMRRSKGEYPIVRFAGRFLGVLWHNRGAARIHTEDLAAMVGNVHQQSDYKQALRGLGLLRDWTGTYRVGTASALYRLTDEAMLDYGAAYSQETERLVV